MKLLIRILVCLLFVISLIIHVILTLWRVFMLLIILLVVHIVIWLRFLNEISFGICPFRVSFILLSINQHLIKVSKIIPFVLRSHLASLLWDTIFIGPGFALRLDVHYTDDVLEILLDHLLYIWCLSRGLIRLICYMEYFMLIREVFKLFRLCDWQFILNLRFNTAFFTNLGISIGLRKDWHKVVFWSLIIGRKRIFILYWRFESATGAFVGGLILIFYLFLFWSIVKVVSIEKVLDWVSTEE